MDIELEKLKKLEHALCDAIDILRDWQVEEVKQECPCADGIDSKACVGCEHSEDGKREYKPYVTVEEFIQDYQKRFPTAVPRPAHTMPLIWIAHKTDGTTRLIVEFSDRSVKIGCKVKPVDFGKLFVTDFTVNKDTPTIRLTGNSPLSLLDPRLVKEKE